MKKFLLVSIFAMCSACVGHNAIGFNAVGRPIQVGIEVPNFCPAFKSMTLQLGVSPGISSHASGMLANITLKDDQYDVAKQAVDENKLLRVVVDTARWNWCTHNNEATKVEIFEAK